MYEILQTKISQCDVEIEKILNTTIDEDNNKISSGKILSNMIPKESNRLRNALRNAANAIGNLKDSTPLSDFFKRINFRKGRVSAISATARKLAIIVWNMVVKNQAYVNPEGYLFLDEKRK